MLKRYGFLFFLPLFLHAGFYSWFEEELSPKAKRAKEVLEGLDPLIEQALEEYKVPGVAVGIVVDGHVIYAKGFGYRDIEKKLPVTKETLFAVGSCTKAFTSFAMGTLVDEGLLEWDQPVIDILPEFRLWDQYATTNVTIRDLLTHRTGMPRHEFVWYNSKMSKSEMLKRIRYLEPSCEIRQRYQYGNLMYFTAGLAMETVAGKTWEQQIRERILVPLEMVHTNFSVHDTQNTSNFAHPYVEKENRLKRTAFRNLSLIDSAGALNSNIDDLMIWTKMLLAGGVHKDRPLISPATLQELCSPQVTIPGLAECSESLINAYGIGWVVSSYRGHYYVSHDGVSDGFTSVVGFYPNDNIGIVVLCNRNMTTFPRFLSFVLIDRILEVGGHDWFEEGIADLKKYREAMQQTQNNETRLHKMGTQPSHPIEDYLGTYEHPGYGRLTISLVDDHLHATYNDLTFVLGHWHYDIFKVIEEKQDIVVSVEGMRFKFHNNGSGEIGELRVPFEPSSEDIVFKKLKDENLSNIAYLRQFTGVYEIYGYTVEVVIRNHMLLAIIPGQPVYELIPSTPNEFIVKELTGSTVRFMMDPTNKVAEVLLVHPYGAFTANPRGK